MNFVRFKVLVHAASLRAGGAEHGHGGAGAAGAETVGGQRGGQDLHQPVCGPASTETAEAEPPPGDCQRSEQEGERFSCHFQPCTVACLVGRLLSVLSLPVLIGILCGVFEQRRCPAVLTSEEPFPPRGHRLSSAACRRTM